ncbi:MAG: hypothetical protein R3242_01185 [Akkermansiaceae bacterium]|nr:hypothetical protein [Akkermansiaceae bacterium]
MPQENRKPWWLYPNLLSLDAPLVSLAWLHVFASTWRLGYHPIWAYICLGLVVWSIYVFDRLLDVSMMKGRTEELEPRHHFHQRHRKLLVFLVCVAMLAAIWILLTEMPRAIFHYLLIGGVMVAGFFGLSMLATENQEEVGLSKNLMAGLAFAFGTAMTAHVYASSLSSHFLNLEFTGAYGLLTSREFLCFAMLCVINIAAIDFWEHSKRSEDEEIKAKDELSIMVPLVLLAFASLTFALQQPSLRPFHYSILTGVALLYFLNRRRSQFSMDALRVMADLALLAPVLVFHAASRSEF